MRFFDRKCAPDRINTLESGEKHMKRTICYLMAVVLLCAFLFPLASPAEATGGHKEQTKRTIAIVFDNSGSMYYGSGESQDRWCRATYAMEVFASMLNEGDQLLIYPMHTVTIDGVEYNKKSNPLKITDPGLARIFEKMETIDALGTPSDTIDLAVEGLKKQPGEADNKWLIVLTDGDKFDSLERGDETRNFLSGKLSACSRDVNVLYLGIGEEASEPEANSEGHTLVVRKAASSSEVLSMLTDMCNLIFGRDTLPASHLKDKSMTVDVSLNKLIVFVQGEKVSDLEVVSNSGNPAGTGSPKIMTTRFSTQGARNKRNDDGSPQFLIDEKLQGMMVIYEGVSIGSYDIRFNGKADSIEAYYEPNVALEFTFTDDEGREVESEKLYEGNYRINFGLKDAITGEYTNSTLMGDTHYSGSYTVNGKETAIESHDKKGEVQVPLKVEDSFKCHLTVTYLSGYQFTAAIDDTYVKPRPPLDLKLSISGGQPEYEIKDLEEGKPFQLEVTYNDVKLTGEELKSVEVDWDPDKSAALLTPTYKDDYIELRLSHRDPSNPEATPIGSNSIPVTVSYQAPASEKTESLPEQLTYSVILSPPKDLRLEISGGQDVYELATLEEGEHFRAEVYYHDNKLTGKALESVEITWDPEQSGAVLKKTFLEDHYDIVLFYKDPSNPESTPTGDFSFPMTALYQEPASEEAESKPVTFSYSIADTRSPLQVKLNPTQSYYVISEIEQGEPVRAEITANGLPLSPEEFSATTFSVSCTGIRLRQTAVPEESAYLLYLEKDDSLKAGSYEISCYVSQTDEIGRVTEGRDKTEIQLGTISILLKWVITCSALALLVILTLLILNIKAMPTKLHVNKKGDSSMSVDGEDETKNTTFSGALERRRLDVHSKFAGKKIGIVMDTKPGKGSCLKTPHVKRSLEVNPASVKKLGNATITEATIGTVKYVFDEEKRTLMRMPKSDKPFTIKHGARITYSGFFQSNGENKSFNVATKLNFKKKK